MAVSVISGSINPTALEAQLNSVQKISDLTENIRKELSAISAEYDSQVDYAKSIASSMLLHKEDMSRVKQISTNISHIQDRILTINDRLGESYVKQEELKKLENRQDTVSKQLAIQREKAERAVNAVRAQGALATNEAITEAENYLKTVDAAITANNANLVAIQSMQGNLGKANAEAHKFENKTRILSNLFKSLSRIPIIGPLLDASRVADKFLINNKEGFNELGSQIKRAFSSPIFLGAMAFAAWSKLIDIFKSLAKLVFAYDENITKVANTLAITKAESKAILSTFLETEKVAGNFSGILDVSFMNAKNVGKAIVELNDQFGTSMMLSRDMIESQIALTEQMGLSTEEAAGIQKYQLLSNVSAKAVLDSVTKQNKIGISYRKIIGEIAKVSTEISATYKNQPELLAKAAIEASKIGMNLEDTKKIADSLLNFESSIDNELKAELLTGKQLNFEKARSLALDGKSAEAAGLLVEQMGGMNELSKLNVVQRKALAESIGLSSEELTKFAQQQEIVRNLGRESADNIEEEYNLLKAAGKEREAAMLMDSIKKQKNGEILAQDIMKASVNQRYEQSVMRIKEVFADMLAGPITGILTSISELLKHTTLLKVLALTLLGVFTAITVALTAAAVAMAFATGGANVLLGSLAVGAVVAGVAAVSKVKSSNEYVQDSAISPDGRITISTPKGKIVPDRQDSIITTTNPQGLLGGSSLDTSNLENKLDKLISAVEKGGNVYIDSTRSGTAYGMAGNSFA